MAAALDIPCPPGYQKLVPFDRSSHRNLGVCASAATFASSQHAIYLTQKEIGRAAQDYPVVFARDANQAIVPVALVGVVPGNNLLCNIDGHWHQDCYVPAYVRRYPFMLVRLAGAEQKSLICVDESQLQPSATPLIDELGQTTPHWEAMEKLVQEFDHEQIRSQAFCSRLEELDLFEKFDADFHPNAPVDGGGASEGKRARINGLLRINRKHLNALDDADLAALVRNQYLSSIEAHLNSFNRFDRLLNLYATAQSKPA